jgi:hypothetical protein
MNQLFQHSESNLCQESTTRDDENYQDGHALGAGVGEGGWGTEVN